MINLVRWVLVALLVSGGAVLGGATRADVDCGASCTNNQDGDNDSDTGQGGESASGDAVAGQVTGVVSSGESSVDATNHSEDVDVSSGDASASNEVANFTGQADGEVAVGTADVTVGANAVNAQDGDNSTDVTQAANSTSGDGVAGQVIGVVTSAGGSADVVAANTSEDVDVESGDSDSVNVLSSFVGQTEESVTVGAADVEVGNVASNAQDGDNDLSAEQSVASSSGDGVAGQVLGVVSAGDASIDATNHSEDVDVETGDATSDNDFASFTGQNRNNATVDASDVILGTSADNAQDGDNATEVGQAAESATGDAVGGQVAGVVTSAGGSADVVAANTSEDVDVDTGDADSSNALAALTGQNRNNADVTVADVVTEFADQAQEGDNDLEADQSASASTGDGVGGQVLGVVSAGDTSVDATNSSEDVTLDSGDATSDNALASITGQNRNNATVDAADVVVGNNADNAQEGDNSTEVGQSAESSTGDAVGGQVAGVVTSAGGSADIVAANTSEDVGIDTGDADSDNVLASFVGQNRNNADVLTTADVVIDNNANNAQDGDNDLSADQSASSTSGDGVGGQVLGVVSAGDASIDATNHSEDVDLGTGDAASNNDLASFTGQNRNNATVDASDVIVGNNADNAQEGDNSTEAAQSAESSTGDAVGGQVAGVVTSAGGSADIVAANTSEDVDIDTGDADSANVLASFVGQNRNNVDVVTASDVVIDNNADNAQDGDNDLSADQSASAASGDGVGGQVLGVVSAGDASIDATNHSEDVDLETGDGEASNDFAGFVGQNLNNATIDAADVVIEGNGDNVQDGDNEKELTQDATAESGDAVGGQVAGVVTSAGGSADLVLANTSEDIDGESGDSDSFNTDEEFVGQSAGDVTIGVVES